MSRAKRHNNGPFAALPEVLKQAGIQTIDPDKQKVLSKPAPIVQPLETPIQETDEELFARSMERVERTRWARRPLISSPPLPKPARDQESQDKKLMEAALAGIPALAVPDHPEYIEGWIGVAGKRLLPDLRTGTYSIQEQIDLHGLSRTEARVLVEESIARMARYRSCCVKIIHGRGINSPADRAVLKESLQHWLSTRRMSRYVVAYASAQLNDGGVGAVYVLLQKQ